MAESFGFLGVLNETFHGLWFVARFDAAYLSIYALKFPYERVQKVYPQAVKMLFKQLKLTKVAIKDKTEKGYFVNSLFILYVCFI